MSDYMEQRGADGIPDFEWRNVRTNGEIFWLRGTPQSLRNQMRIVWDLLNGLIEIDESPTVPDVVSPVEAGKR